MLACVYLGMSVSLRKVTSKVSQDVFHLRRYVHVLLESEGEGSLSFALVPIVRSPFREYHDKVIK